jgi:hypothetical protein
MLSKLTRYFFLQSIARSLHSRYPHHHELAEEGGVVAVHQIANKRDSLIGIATVSLADPKKVRPFLKKLLFNKGAAFDPTAAQPHSAEPAASAPAKKGWF